MSFVDNRNSIEATQYNKKYAIFITKHSIKGVFKRYAIIETSPFIYKTYEEMGGEWHRCENLSNFLMWNGDFQGYDDISSIVVD